MRRDIMPPTASVARFVSRRRDAGRGGRRRYDDVMPARHVFRPPRMAALAVIALGGLVGTVERHAGAAPDPVRAEYDAVLAAYKAEQWAETRSLASAFVAAHPDF